MRRRAGFKSAKAFAEHLGMSAGTYIEYEQGRRSFTLERAWEFADELGCTIDELAGRNYPPHKATDPRKEELLDCWDICSEERRDTLLATAQDFATLERFRPERAPVPAEGQE